MTTINNPQPGDLQAGDTVFLTHEKLVGEVGVKFDGTNLDFPNEQATPDVAIGVGFTLVRAERIQRDTITIKGSITGDHAGRPNNLSVVAILPSGAEKVLYINGIGIGERSAVITLADFEG